MSQAITLDWNSASKLISVLVEFHNSRKNNEKVDLGDAADKIAAAFGIEDVTSFLEESIQGGLSESLGEQGSSAVSAIVAKMYKPVVMGIGKYIQGDINAHQLLDNLNDTYLDGAREFTRVLQNALGFDLPEDAASLMENYSLVIVSVYCFAAAYKIYRKAADDAQIARERRIEVEKLCEESVSQLKARRLEMQAMVDDYLLGHLMPFEVGMKAMDKAVFENDDDGYISSNMELWQALGHEGQYRSKAEFDSLMSSDEAFRL